MHIINRNFDICLQYHTSVHIFFTTFWLSYSILTFVKRFPIIWTAISVRLEQGMGCIARPFIYRQCVIESRLATVDINKVWAGSKGHEKQPYDWSVAQYQSCPTIKYHYFTTFYSNVQELFCWHSKLWILWLFSRLFPHFKLQSHHSPKKVGKGTKNKTWKTAYLWHSSIQQISL